MQIAAAALAVISALWAPTAVAAACGQVLALSGAATLQTSTGTRAIAVGDPVEPGDAIDAPAGAKVRLRMNDGTIVTIAPGTRVTIDKYDVAATGTRQDAELTMAKGLLHAVVAAGAETPNFEIKTATGVAAVRGTDWYVDLQGDATQIYVVTGNVSLADPTGQKPVLIPAMSTSSVEANKQPTEIRPVTPAELAPLAEATAFYDGLCQCIDLKSNLLGSCRLTSEACKAACKSTPYSFVPYARGSCGGS